MRLLSIFWGLFLPILASAQLVNPISWEAWVERGTKDTLIIYRQAAMEKGWHLYTQDIPPDGPIPTRFFIIDSGSVQWAGPVTADQTPTHEYEKAFDMELSYYHDTVTFQQKVVLGRPVDSIEVGVEYMICNDEMCLPPDAPTFKVAVPQATVTQADSGLPEGLWGLFLAGFIGGLIALVTPCVLPMIPLTVGFFTKMGSASRAAAIRKALGFGLSIVVIYTGLTFGITKLMGAETLNQLASNAVMNLIFFVLFVIFAVSFFGAFEIALPSSWVTAVDRQSERGGLIGIFFLAFALALVSFSCTGPIIGTVLVQTALTGKVWAPITAMLGFSVALAIPFMLFAMFPAWLQSLPRSGSWMNTVKVSLAFLELALALKFLSNVDLAYHWGVLNREIFLALWIAIFALWGVYLLGGIRFVHDAPVQHLSIGRVLMAMLVWAFVIYLLPGMWGAPLKLVSAFPPPSFYKEWQQKPLLQPRMTGTPASQGHAATSETSDEPPCPHGLPCFHSYEEALASAKKTGRPLLLDFTGWSCVNCRKMEENVWTDPEVFRILAEDVVLASLYVDDKRSLPNAQQYTSEVTGRSVTTYGEKWSDLQISRFRANSQPYYVLIDTNEQVLVPPRGYTPDIQEYLGFLREGIKKFHQP